MWDVVNGCVYETKVILSAKYYKNLYQKEFGLALLKAN